MTLTLNQMAEIAEENSEIDRSRVLRAYACIDLLGAIPFMDIPGGSYSYVQEGKLPGVAFQGLPGVLIGNGISNPQVERLRIVGGLGFRGFNERENQSDLDVDLALIATHGDSVRELQERMKIKGSALSLASRFINGDSGKDPREFDGLRKRIVGRQLLAAGSSSGGDPLRTSVLNSAIGRVDNPTHLIMSKKMRNLLSSVGRGDGCDSVLLWDKNELGERASAYCWTEIAEGRTIERSLPILATDYDECNAQVIDFNEDCPGGGESVGGSIYVVNFSDTGVCGLQQGTPKVTDLGEVPDAQVLRRRILWLISLAVLSGRAAARVWGIEAAAVISDHEKRPALQEKSRTIGSFKLPRMSIPDKFVTLAENRSSCVEKS